MQYPGHETLRRLRLGEVVDLDGLLLVMAANGEVAPGVTYVGARNTVDIYVCKEVDVTNGWVVPEGFGYAFNTSECIGVRVVDDPPDYTVPPHLLAVIPPKTM